MDRDESKLQLHEALTRDDLWAMGEVLSEGAKYDAVDDEGTAPMLDGELLERHLEQKKAGESFGGDEFP